MKIRRIKNTVASMGLLVVITLAGAAVSLAQDSSPIGLSYSFGVHHSSPDKASTLGGDACIGLIPNSGDLTVSYPRSSETRTVLHASGPRNLLSDFAGVKSRKIALHLLDSILLI
jgi:hypothetical protein